MKTNSLIKIKHLNRGFPKEDVEIANNYMERCSKSNTTGESLLKTTEIIFNTYQNGQNPKY
jgi:hypothetical protein